MKNGRGERIRTSDPLVPNSESKNSKCLAWCRLGTSKPFLLILSCTDVVPKLYSGSSLVLRPVDISFVPWLPYVSMSAAQMACGGATSWRKLVRAALTASFVFDLIDKPKRSTKVIVTSVPLIAVCELASRSSHRPDQRSFERDAGRGICQWICGCVLVVPDPYPAHHSQTTDVIAIQAERETRPRCAGKFHSMILQNPQAEPFAMA
jgi:hypothetical protein